MSSSFERGGPVPSRVEYSQNPDGSIFVALPPEITEEWAQDFTEEFGNEEFQATLQAEDWLVQKTDEDGVLPISSAYYEMDDRPMARTPTIRGTVWDAGLAYTPQYVEGNLSPVVALLNASLVKDGKEELIADEPGHLVLVRLDRVLAGLTLTRLADAEPQAA